MRHRQPLPPDAEIETVVKMHAAFRTLRAYCPACGQVEAIVGSKGDYIHVDDHKRFDYDKGWMVWCELRGTYALPERPAP